MFCTHLWDIPSIDPIANLALEHALLDGMQPDAAHVLFWRNSPSVFIGRAQNPWHEADLPFLQANAIPLVRRISGGGTVFHDLGNLNVSVIAPKPAVYHRDLLLQWVLPVLEAHGITPSVDTRHSVFVAGRKISGSAFRETAHYGLHHASFLVSADLKLLSQCLRGREDLAVRGVPSVPASVSNIGELATGLTVAKFQEQLMASAAKHFQQYGAVRWRQATSSALPAGMQQAVSQYCQQYTSWEWNYGRSPKFFQHLPDGTSLQVIHGHIASVIPAPTTPDPNALQALIGQRFSPSKE